MALQIFMSPARLPLRLRCRTSSSPSFLSHFNTTDLHSPRQLLAQGVAEGPSSIDNNTYRVSHTRVFLMPHAWNGLRWTGSTHMRELHAAPRVAVHR